MRDQILVNLVLIVFAAAMAWLSRPLVPGALWPVLDIFLALGVGLGVLAVFAGVVRWPLVGACWFALSSGIWFCVTAWPQTGGPGAIAALAHWPVVLLLLAAALIGGRPGHPVGPMGAVLAGAALFSCAVALLHQAFVPEALRVMLLRGAVHQAIIAMGCICLVLTLLPLAVPVAPRIAGLRGTLVGLLPLLGFFGTVAGLMEAVAALPLIFAGASPDPILLRGLLDGLALAFETTLLGIGAAILLITLGALVASDEGA
jgi:hypothetical protein